MLNILKCVELQIKNYYLQQSFDTLYPNKNANPEKLLKGGN